MGSKMILFNKRHGRSKAKAKPQALCGQVDCFVLCSLVGISQGNIC